jgi:hypothetical protein
MIIVKLATAGLLGMIGVSAIAQVPSVDPSAGYQAGLNHGDRDSLPRSTKASDIVPAETSGTSAPMLPSPDLGLDAPSRDYLRTARVSLAAGHTGRAQQSLEMAETRLPGGSTAPDQAKLPSDDPTVTKIREALHGLGHGDRAQAIQIIDTVLNS